LSLFSSSSSFSFHPAWISSRRSLKDSSDVGRIPLIKSKRSYPLLAPFCHLFALVASFAVRISILHIFTTLTPRSQNLHNYPSLGLVGGSRSLKGIMTSHSKSVPPVPNQGQDFRQALRSSPPCVHGDGANPLARQSGRLCCTFA
jgi:hypothetical protein